MTSIFDYSATNSILLISADEEAGHDVAKMLSQSGRYRIKTVEFSKLDDLKQQIRADVILVVFAKLTAEQLRALRRFKSLQDDIHFVVISDVLEDGLMREFLKLNATDWLQNPLDINDLQNSLVDCMKLENSNANRVHAVTSVVGGAGATSIATSLCDILNRNSGAGPGSVALVDLDFSTGNCGYLLNMQNSFNLHAISGNSARIDAEFIRTIGLRHNSGFNLFSFKSPEVILQSDASEMILRLLDAISLQHNQTIVDLPYYETSWKTNVLSAVNSTTLVTYVSVPAIKHTREAIQRFTPLVAENPSTYVIFNRYEKPWFGGGLSYRTVTGLFDKSTSVRIANDKTTLSEAENRGVLPCEVNSQSRFLKDLRLYAQDFLLSDQIVQNAG